MEEKAAEERWSALPTLLVWMVKDRLNLVDNSRLASVCKNWNTASKDYTVNPKQQSNIVPWLMHKPPRTTACEFINFSTKEKLILDIPFFDKDALFWFSRQGWLLFGLTTCNCILLYNVHNRSRILIPGPGKELKFCKGFFSSFEDGTPSRVILVERLLQGYPSVTVFVQIVEVGDEYDTWNALSYTYTPRHTFSRGINPMRRKKIYNQYKIFFGGNRLCLYHDSSLTMITFDMRTLEWREVDVGRNRQLQARENLRMMMSENGEVVQINGSYSLATFEFYRMNDSWKELQSEDVISARWYISSVHSNHLAVEESPETNEVYILDSHAYYNYGDINDDGSCTVRQTIRVHDLINGSNRKEMVEWFEFKMKEDKLRKAKFSKRLPHVYWVDLGKTEKPPACCVGTKFSIEYTCM